MSKIEVPLKDYHRYSKKKTLICHIMSSPHSEITQIKKKLFHQELQWKDRMYPIAQDAIWFDRKGIGHIHLEVNESDGTMRFLFHEKTNLVDENNKSLDMCGKCGDRISIDARNVRDLLKRKTINTFWGLDNSYVLLLMILGIGLVASIGAVFYLIGDLQTTHELLNKYLVPVPKPVTPSG